MTAAERRYVLDANLFVRGFREAPANAELQRFHFGFAPFEYLSAVVVQELVAGARSGVDRRALDRHVVDLFRRRGRIFTPSSRPWHESGDVLAGLARRDRLELSRVSKSAAAHKIGEMIDLLAGLGSSIALCREIFTTPRSTLQGAR